MLQLSAVRDLRAQVSAWRAAGESVALVPTMGNLHEGHLELVRLARRHAERVVCSVFVNPTQFGPSEDFERYPRTPDRDAALLRGEAVDLLFMPVTDEMYPFGPDAATRIHVPGLSDVLCGAIRAGHFDGVATVVLRLFHMVGADLAVFGQKDYQQQLIVRRLVADLSLAIRIVMAPTSREPDGLARSSRNQYLTAAERAVAPRLHAELRRLAEGVAAGEPHAALCARAETALAHCGFEPEYVELRAGATLEPARAGQRPLVALAAARLGRARLIDNLLIP
jgi:pantoate--beta-alanine ligase